MSSWLDRARRHALRRVGVIFVAAVVLNFCWEMAQMPFYLTSGTWLEASAGCLSASFGDGGMVLLIYIAGAAVLRRLDWICQPGPEGWAVTLAAGFILAVVFERAALRAGRWAYSPLMPRLLFTSGLGALPILQMTILPPLIFRIASAIEAPSVDRY